MWLVNVLYVSLARVEYYFSIVREQIDCEKRCRAVTAKGDPIISTKFIFFPLVRAVSNCVKQSTEITCLALEGLPLTVVYIQSIANVALIIRSLPSLQQSSCF